MTSYFELTQNYIGNQRAIEDEEMWNEYYYYQEELKQLYPPVITLEELERENRNYDNYLTNSK